MKTLHEIKLMVAQCQIQEALLERVRYSDKMEERNHAVASSSKKQLTLF